MDKLVLILSVIFLNGILADLPTATPINYDTVLNLINEDSLLDDGHPLKERKCSSPGIMCKTCSTTVFCIEIDDGVFEEHASDTCLPEQTCLENKCTITVNPQCTELANIPFTCSGVGVFPDPFNCRKYHYCVPTWTTGENPVAIYKDFVSECSTGFKYNSKTTYCDKKLVNNRCFDNISEFPVSLCQKNGHMGALPENPSIFYICEYYETPPSGGTTTTGAPAVLYPFLYLCAHGKIFHEGQMRCVDP